MSLNRFYTPTLMNSISKQYAAGSPMGNFFHGSSLLSGGPRKTAAEKKRAPPKGYRAPTPFSLLTKELYKPGMKIGESSKEISAKWKNLSPDQLQVYKSKAVEIGKDRKEKFDSLPQDEKAILYLKSDTQRKIRKLKNQLQESLAASH